MSERAAILLVDDRDENLLALEALLEPLGHLLVRANSGTAALRELLLHDFACILLDVDMPVIDGFTTAQLIKQRGRSQHVPIVFVTALPSDDRQIFQGYEVGAVDYIFKPIDPTILRSKVAVFVDLWEKSRRLHEQELLALERANETRYGQLADAMPQIVWRADVDGRPTYFNERWFEYTGMSPVAAEGAPWSEVVHPEDRCDLVAKLGTGEVELELRFRGADGVYRWHLVRTAAIRDEAGRVESWVGTATDIDDRKQAEEQWAFLLEAGDALASSLDYRDTLAQVADLAVGRVSDWCSVHIVEPDGSIVEVAVAHNDPAQVAFARELQDRYPPDPTATTGAAAVIRTGEAELVPLITESMIEASVRDDLHRDLLRQLELRSYLCVPLPGRDRAVGAITFVSSRPGRAYGAADLRLAEELARRAATAIENARLYREAEHRAEAARALATIGDGVVLVDRTGRIRLWNTAAERITGLREPDLLGKEITSTVPGWSAVADRVTVAAGAGAAPTVESVPLDLGGRELWLSLSAVGSEDGVVYAFRDLTEERKLETMRQDLVATVSHELRTPLAAIYGSALTLRREDVDLDDEMRRTLLRVIAEEAARLGEIVNDLLLASQLDSGRLRVEIEPCDPLAIVRAEIEAARAHTPETVQLELDVEEHVPAVAADASQLRQVVANLIDNAIKYSPEGGPVIVSLRRDNGAVRLTVADSGIGIPPEERRRIFEKFYRLDPEMTGGIGGTGLGLYICRELVRRIDGRIWVEENGGRGSTFVVEIPRVAAPVLAESLG